MNPQPNHFLPDLPQTPVQFQCGWLLWDPMYPSRSLRLVSSFQITPSLSIPIRTVKGWSAWWMLYRLFQGESPARSHPAWAIPDRAISGLLVGGATAWSTMEGIVQYSPTKWPPWWWIPAIPVRSDPFRSDPARLCPAWSPPATLTPELKKDHLHSSDQQIGRSKATNWQ